MGAERCLYGTDAPYGFHDEAGEYDYLEIRRWVERMPLSSAELARVLGENFETLISAAR